MSYDSVPDYGGKAPTFEEVMAYAAENGLVGRLNVSKFYDYYKDRQFKYKGVYMDWKSKMHEWASTEKGAKTISAREYEALNKAKLKSQMPSADEVWARVAAI